MLFVQRLYLPPAGAIIINGEWDVSYNEKFKEKIAAPSYLKSKKIAPGIYDDFPRGEYTLTLRQKDGNFRSMIQPVIVFPHIAGNAARVHINGECIGLTGEIFEGRSSIWNVPLIYPIPLSLLQKTLIINVEILGICEVGFPYTPYLFDMSQKSGRAKIVLLSWGEYLINYALGVFLFIGIIFVLLGSHFGKNGRDQLFLGISLIFLTFYLLDYSLVER